MKVRCAELAVSGRPPMGLRCKLAQHLLNKSSWKRRVAEAVPPGLQHGTEGGAPRDCDAKTSDGLPLRLHADYAVWDGGLDEDMVALMRKRYPDLWRRCQGHEGVNHLHAVSRLCR
jgi:hypothetical protein